jgi:N-acetylmuramoyl-L-alanine amidase/cell wall-associated NlpC family hydrolase
MTRLLALTVTVMPVVLVVYGAGLETPQRTDLILPAEPERPFTPAGRPLEGLVITLDPGHGGAAWAEGYAGGVRGPGTGLVEGDLNMLIAAHLQHHLKRAGATVHMTRWDDRKVTLGDTDRQTELAARVGLASRTRSHLLLSIHLAADASFTRTGVLVLSRPPESAHVDPALLHSLAECLRDEVQKLVPCDEPLPPWIGDHPLLTPSDVPALVVEIGFLSSPGFEAWIAERGRFRAAAIGLFNGIVRLWQSHRTELDTLRCRLFPDLTTSKPAAAWGPRPPDAAVENFARVRKHVRRIWFLDRPPATPTEAEWLIEQYVRRVITDHTFCYVRTRVEKVADSWVVCGAANHPHLKKAVGSVLEAAGCQPVRNEIELLPSERLGEARFGVVRVPMALIWAEPPELGGAQTQLLLGERLFLLDITPDEAHLLVHAGEGYIGWVHRDAVLRMTAEQFAAWENARTAVVTRDCLVDDFRVPAGAFLPLVSEGPEGVQLRLPTGVRATSGRDVVTLPRAHVRLPPAVPAGLEAAQTAVEYLTTPYVFAGRSRLGLDCSGLTGVSYAAVGLVLPRDARQQVLVGRLVGTAWHRTALQPGDLLFFCDESGFVFHTGLSLGGARFIHSAPPEVQVSSLDPADPLYHAEWAKAFAFARRPLP